MMQPELLQSSWPFYNIINSTLDQDDAYYSYHMDSHVSGSEFSPSFTTTDDSSPGNSISSIPNFAADFLNFPLSEDSLQETLQMEDFLLDFQGFESIYGCLEESEGSLISQHPSTQGGEESWSPNSSMNSGEMLMEVKSNQSSLTLPGESMEIGNELGILHLLNAYGESMEKGQEELSQVIFRCIKEKSNPVGETVERLAFNLFKDMERESDYLKDESCKNFEAAFKAFYQIFPYGRFAHFAANSAILESMPRDAEIIHIVDFDMGEGIQWPPMIEAIAQRYKEVKLTSIKMGEECDPAPWQQRFEETRRRLSGHARSFGLKLKMEEMKMEELVSETKRMKKRGGRREWLAFNCMVGIPHMGRGRSRRHVGDFLRVAKDLIANSAYRSSVIIYGDGEDCETLKSCSGLGSFFDAHLIHYQALLESMESNFAVHLTEARLAMECLFVGPHLSCKAWLQRWEEMREGCDVLAGLGLEGERVRGESLMEAKELVKEEESLYGVRIGKSENEMVLEWRGTPLVRVSTWRN